MMYINAWRYFCTFSATHRNPECSLTHISPAGRRHMSCMDSCLTGSDTWLPGNPSSSVLSMGLTSPWALNRDLRNSTVSTVRTRTRLKRNKPFVTKREARSALQGTDSGCFWSLRFFGTCSSTGRLHGFLQTDPRSSGPLFAGDTVIPKTAANLNINVWAQYLISESFDTRKVCEVWNFLSVQKLLSCLACCFLLW